MKQERTDCKCAAILHICFCGIGGAKRCCWLCVARCLSAPQRQEHHPPNAQDVSCLSRSGLGFVYISPIVSAIASGKRSAEFRWSIVHWSSLPSLHSLLIRR